MKSLPVTENALVLRTDFSNDAAWEALCEAIQQEGDEGFRAYVDCVSDPDFANVPPAALLNRARGTGRSYLFVVDAKAITDDEHPILVLDLESEPGRTFRVIPAEIWGVENNLTIANMDFCTFADSVDEDGVFRGF